MKVCINANIGILYITKRTLGEEIRIPTQLYLAKNVPWRPAKRVSDQQDQGKVVENLVQGLNARRQLKGEKNGEKINMKKTIQTLIQEHLKQSDHKHLKAKDAMPIGLVVVSPLIAEDDEPSQPLSDHFLRGLYSVKNGRLKFEGFKTMEDVRRRMHQLINDQFEGDARGLSTGHTLVANMK